MTVERTRLSITVAISALLGIFAGAAAAEEACPNRPSATAKAAADGPCAGCIGHTLYEKKGSLQATLLEIRHRYAAWLAEQPQARQAVMFDPWLATPPLPRAEAVPPYSHGSHCSKLVKTLQADHYDVKLSKEEWIKLVTWIDCGAPYYGSYFGRRHLNYQGQPDFRPVPTLYAVRDNSRAILTPSHPLTYVLTWRGPRVVCKPVFCLVESDSHQISSASGNDETNTQSYHTVYDPSRLPWHRAAGPPTRFELPLGWHWPAPVGRQLCEKVHDLGC